MPNVKLKILFICLNLNYRVICDAQAQRSAQTNFSMGMFNLVYYKPTRADTPLPFFDFSRHVYDVWLTDKCFLRIRFVDVEASGRSFFSPFPSDLFLLYFFSCSLWGPRTGSRDIEYKISCELLKNISILV